MLVGQTPDEIQGKPFLDLVPSEWKSKVRDWQQDPNKTASYDFPLRSRHRESCWVRYTFLPSHNDGQMVGLLQDITENKKREKDFIEKNALLRAIIDNIPIAIHAKNSRGEYILSNPAHYHLLGRYAESDVVGKKDSDLLAGTMALRYEKEDKEIIAGAKIILNKEHSGLPNSAVKYLSSTKVALQDDNDNVIGLVGITQDITRRKQQESEVKKREEYYRTLARNLPQSAVFLYDHDLRILAAEGPALFAVQFSGTTLDGKLFSEVLDTSTNEVQELLRIYREALNGNETRMERLYGDVYYRIHVLPVRNESGDIIAGMALTQNIDEQKKSEQAVRASEERSRALINAMPDLMFVAKRDGTITDFRPSFADDVSLSIATDTQTIRQVGLPDVIIDESLIYLELALESGIIQSFEFSQNEPSTDGNGNSNPATRAFEIRMTALNDEEVLTIVRDISPLKRIQDELNHHIFDLTVVRQVSNELSDNLNFEYVAQLALDAAMRLSNAQTGFMAMKQVDDSLTLLSLVGYYDLQQLDDVLQSKTSITSRVMRTQQPELIIDLNADPDYVPLVQDTKALMVIPLMSHERLVGVLHLETRRAERFNQERFQFLQLITGRIAAFLDNANLYRQTQDQVAELRQLYEEVAHLEQLKTDMIRIASHDLKNPLSSISVYLDMLRTDTEDVLTEEQNAHLEIIDKAAQKMGRITKGILSLEKIDQMAQDYSHVKVNLHEQVRLAIGEQMDFAVRKSQSITPKLPDEAVYVEGDALLLHEAVTNLIGNAIKYTPDSGNIEVSLYVADEQVMVRVKDDGYGIPEVLQERLFTPFYRVQTKETQAIEGTGLGLHLVKNIIERHNGKMVFNSIYGKGSTFGFDMPPMPENLD
ncbi:MAG: PAS domain-containing protein [Anaerolineae bacterium]|nr:PAS domain-containing protein [Anaerolineae bacterium]